MSRDKFMLVAIGIGGVLFLGALIGLKFFQATFEARTFNKFSEKKADMWDALWADLRVEACRSNQI